MDSLLLEFDFETVFVEPWSLMPWVAVLGFLVALCNGLVGCYLILRRMSLVGDAISHSVLPGIVIAFIVSQALGGWLVFVGALVAGLATTFLIEALHRRSRLKEDAATGITFTLLFAVGVILVSLYSGNAHIDTECVLYGELGYVAAQPLATVGGVAVAPPSVLQMAGLAVAVVALIVVFYRPLLVSSFDPGLAASLGIDARIVHYGLMAVLSLVVVASFEAVGSILVVAMLVLPGATALLLTDRLVSMLWLSAFHALVSTAAGFHLAIYLGVSFGASMVVAGFALFLATWVCAPQKGLLAVYVFRRQGGEALA